MSTIQRVTGTNSGLDVDSLVKTAMQPYKTKVDKEVQNEKVMEYQQDQYKKIMSDASDFYDKYFDVLKSGSMMATSTYQTETFTSTDGTKVTAKGLAGASLDNYSVSVTQLAAKASDSLSINTTGNQTIKIGTATVTFKAVTDGNTTVSNYNAAIVAKKTEYTNIINGTGTDADKKAAQSALDDLNNNTITAKYSEFSKSITFTASSFGGDGFTLNSNSKAEDKYLEATIKNSSGTVYTISSTDKKTSNSITIDNVQFDFKAVGASTSTTPTASLNDISALTPVAVGGDITPITELTALAEDSTTTKTTAADGTKTTVTTSGTKTTTRVTTSAGATTTTTTDTSQPGITSVVDKNGVITTTDTSNSGSGSGYTLQTVKTGTTTITTKTNDDGTIPIAKKIETSGTTKTTTTTLKNGSTTTITKDVYDGTTTTTTSTTKNETSDGTTTTVVGADGTTTTTQIKVGSDGTTNKTVTTSGGTALTELTATSPLSELTALPEDGTTTSTTAADGSKTTVTKSADETKTTTRVTDGSGNTTTTTTDTNQPGITSVIDKNGIITTTNTNNGIITIKNGTKTTTTKLEADGSTTTTVVDGSITTITTTKDTTKTVVDGTTNTTTTTKVGADGSLTTTIKGGKTTVTNSAKYNTPTSLAGSTDVSALKDKIVKFVDDYNTLISSINTKIFETRDKNYMPLTDEQKAAMTDSQITAWEKKAQTGLLRKDSDLQRVVSEMKSAMSTVISGSGLSLEKIGISPVKDYTDKNGMLTVDEDKLTQALEDNGGDVKDLFTRVASSTDSGGALTQLKSALYNEFKTSTSSLSQKAGLVGSSTEFDNTLTNNIYKKKQLIKDLNSSLTDKENALYKKYSNLETMMQSLNSQQSSLASMLGTK